MLELPAGKLEKGSTPLENGKRELLEETGAVGYSYISLGQVYPSPGYTDEIIHIFFAENSTRSEQKLDEGEFLNAEFLPLDDVVSMIESGEICDAKTVAAIYKYLSLK